MTNGIHTRRKGKKNKRSTENVMEGEADGEVRERERSRPRWLVGKIR